MAKRRLFSWGGMTMRGRRKDSAGAQFDAERKENAEAIAAVEQELALIKDIKNLPLSEFFARLVAARDGISPDRVTPGYIAGLRQRRIYPDARFEGGSEYGGYTGDRLVHLTRNEIDKLSLSVERELDSLLDRP